MTSQPEHYELEVFDSNSMDWLELPIEQIAEVCRSSHSRSTPTPECPARFCVTTPGSLTRGIPPVRARHVCVEGTLRTHEGDFGPGSFVWFPEGMTMYHGATEDSDCLMLFITNKYSLHIRE